jgi:hypothetical protein
MDESKIAYLILAHTDPAHLEKLIHAIDYKARIFIHVDAKSRVEDFAKIKLPHSAKFIENRVRVSWGALSIIRATLNLIIASLNSGEKFSHLVLLSGQDYPIKAPAKIYDFLTQNSQKQFIRFVHMKDSGTPYMERILSYWFWEPFFPAFPIFDRYIRLTFLKIFQQFRPVLFKKPLKDIIPAFGSQWWAITPECAAYIIKFVAENLKFMDFYQYSHAPDEHFFHTIVANSPFLSQTDGFDNRENCGPNSLPNLHLIPVSLNKVHTEIDFDELKMSDKLFVRKLTSKESLILIRLIDNNLLQ